MKGIILAGGTGSRLYPLTHAISKQLIPVYDKPMIYYPLSTLISLGIKDILLISTKDSLPLFMKLLGDGKQFGINIQFACQDKPAGIAEALIIGEQFINKDKVALILGDNIFISDSLNTNQKNAFDLGAKIFLSKVKDPERYGVAKIENGEVSDIVEKPKSFISDFAVTGLYFYDFKSVQYSKSLKPSLRGELEITDLNKIYLEKSEVHHSIFEENSAWLDAGTFSSLLDASNLISSLQKRSGSLVGSPEIASFKNGFISKNELIGVIKSKKGSKYFSILEKEILET